MKCMNCGNKTTAHHNWSCPTCHTLAFEHSDETLTINWTEKRGIGKNTGWPIVWAGLVPDGMLLRTKVCPPYGVARGVLGRYATADQKSEHPNSCVGTT